LPPYTKIAGTLQEGEGGNNEEGGGRGRKEGGDLFF